MPSASKFGEAKVLALGKCRKRRATKEREPDHGKEELFVASEMPEDAKIILRRGIIGRNLSLPRTIFAFFLHGILNCINFVVELLSSMLGTHILTNMQTNKPKD